ncbi:SpoIID/LytB domain-containing protein [Brevibacillus borstelensis]|uniref:SpoIID/LytB domain-containing protein n=1 Tax=Brevibacillus borstelensis TaxID=45462 RepID=UPI0030BF5AC5
MSISFFRWSATSLVFFLVLSITMTVVIPVSFAKEHKGNSPKSLISERIKAIDEQRWSDLADFWVEQLRNEMKDFYENEENEQEKLGIFNVKSAKMVDMKELSDEIAATSTDIDYYRSQYDTVATYYVATDLLVHEEDKYHMNGVNYQLYVLAKEKGEWRILEVSDAPVENFVEWGVGFGTKDEKSLAKVYKERQKGIFLNRKGNTINSYDHKMKNSSQKKDFLAVDDHVEPGIIRIYMTYPENKEYYKCKSNCVKAIGFRNTYLENVLPNEWISSWHEESLKAGAMSVKMFAWWYVYHPKRTDVGADLSDQFKDSQEFHVESSTPETDDAIYAVRKYGLETTQTSRIFPVYHRAGSNDSSGKAGGIVRQKGTQYLAKKEGYDYLEILQYYLNGSNYSSDKNDVEGENVRLFTAR